MYNFEYVRAGSLKDAEGALGDEEAKLLAGGMTLLPTLKMRLAAPTKLIDLNGLGDLAGIRVDGSAVTIGAMTRHAEVARSAEVKRAIPALAYLAGLIGDPAVRNRGTIGGSIANNDPAADYPAAALALNATIKTTRGSHEADRFFTGMFDTALAEGEIITEVSFPIPERAAYTKFRNPASRYAIVGVMVAKTKQGARVGVTGAAPCVFRVPEMEKALDANWSPEAVAGIKVPADGLNADIHASAEYRAHLVTVMAKRAVAAAS